MMYKNIAQKSLTQGTIDAADIDWILSSEEVQLLPLLQAAYEVRSTYFENKVKIHILNNVQSGGCAEDCKYCAQSKNSENVSAGYPMKNEVKIIEEARQAYESGAYRHCMVFSGRELGGQRIDRICDVVQKIKNRFPMEICVSAGFLTPEEAAKLAASGVNRYNHNLNTSSTHYPRICSSHDYAMRVATIKTAKASGLDICSGVIIGMGETVQDIVQMIAELKAVDANSIPVNFFIPVEGHRVPNPTHLTSIYCLKVLAVFRLALPHSEIRASAGREYHLRALQPLCLYAVNSIFAKGYLTTGGDDIKQTQQMISDSGFVIEEIS